MILKRVQLGILRSCIICDNIALKKKEVLLMRKLLFSIVLIMGIFFMVGASNVRAYSIPEPPEIEKVEVSQAVNEPVGRTVEKAIKVVRIFYILFAVSIILNVVLVISLIVVLKRKKT